MTRYTPADVAADVGCAVALLGVLALTGLLIGFGAFGTLQGASLGAGAGLMAAAVYLGLRKDA